MTGQTMKWTRLSVAAAFVLMVPAGLASTLHVPSQYPTIQAAITAAASGDVVEIADGTYVGPDNKNLNFAGKAITVRSASGNPALCVIDCEGDGRGFVFDSGEDSNSIAEGLTITNGYVDSSSPGGAGGGGVYCGFNSNPTITNCTISGNSAEEGGGGVYCGVNNAAITGCTISGNSADYGGGISCNNGGPEITNCTISGNTASGSYGYGGGIACGQSSPTITNCTISGNAADGNGNPSHVYGGGGIGCIGGSPEITDCTISGNATIGWGGGGIACVENGNATITNCTVDNNTATRDGGGILCWQSSPMITDCTISENSAVSGAGFRCDDTSAPTLTGCTISGNAAFGPDNYGGGIGCTNSSPTITDCTINGNTASGGNSNGGGIYGWQSNLEISNCTISGNTGNYGGGIYFWGNSSLTITNCAISGNSANNGGGVYNTFSSPLLMNCTFSENSATSDGGGMDNDTSSPTLINCTFSRNTAPFGSGMFNVSSNPMLMNCILWGGAASGWAQILNSSLIPPSTPVVTYSCVEGGTGEGWFGAGCIDADPRFLRAPDPGPDGNWDGVDDDYGDLRLACTSPCLDAGTNTTSPPLPPADLGGNPRIVDGIVDMGAHEAPNQAFLFAPGSIDVPEGGTADFTVALACDPGGIVVVSVDYDSGDPDITIGSGSELTFDPNTYEMGQLVTLAAAEDGDQIEGATRFRIEAEGIPYSFVTAREIENDIGPLLFVDPNATGAGDGTSWTDAFTDLQDALDVATAAPIAVDQIWVAAGTYKPSATTDPNDARTATFQAVNGVSIYGGFAGIEDPVTFDLADRDFAANETILSADLNGDDGTGGDNSENSYHVVIGMNLDSTAVLDGVTITSGNADGSINSYSSNFVGGGMLNWFDSNPTLTNCTFSGNSSLAAGGMGNLFNSSPTLTNCAFYGNSASGISSPSGGGGMTNAYNSNPTLTNCTFSGNSTASFGGGVVNAHDSSARLTNCILWGNAAADGSQVHNNNATPTFSYCDIDGSFSAGSWDDSLGVNGGGNIDADPLFVDPDGLDNDPSTWEDNDYRIGASSPCIDAGDNTAVPPDTLDVDGDGDTIEPLPIDLDASPRFIDDSGMPDTGSGTPPIVDMGAYEFQGQTCFGDLDGDDAIGLSDLATLLANYGAAGGMTYADGDLDADGDVDLADLATLLAIYGTSCSCPGDLDGDGAIGLADLATLLASYGQPGPWSYEDGDLDEDGDVDLADLATLLAVYGTACE